MKTQWILSSLMGLFLFTAIACQDESPEPESTITEEETVEVIEAAIVADSEGMAQEAEEMAMVAQTYGTESYCGLSGDSTITRSISKPQITADYTIAWDWELICDGIIPQSLLFNRTTVGSYETNRMSSEDSAQGNWSISNLVTGQEYLVTGEYQRSGNQTSKIVNMNSFSSVLNIQYQSITIDKLNEEITGGVGSFQFTGTSSTGDSVEYNGSIEFLGDQEALLTLNGTTYTINW